MRHKLIISLVVSMFILVIAFGCATPQTQAPATAVQTTEADKSPIKIGIIANQSSAVGKGAVASAEMAADEINAAGGVLGRRIEIITGDSQMQVPHAVAEYKKLVMIDKVVAVIAAESTDLVAPMQDTGADLFYEYPHICTCPGTSGIVLTDRVVDNYAKYKFFFRTFADPIARYLSGIGIAHDVVKKWGVKKVAILMDDLDWTKIYREGYPNPKTYAPSPYFAKLGDEVMKRDCSKGLPPQRDMWKAVGMEVVYEAKIAVNEKMFLPIFESIASSGAEYIDGHALAYLDSVTMTKQWAESAAKDIPLHISGGAIQMPGAWSATGGAILGLLLQMPSIEYEITPMTIPYMRNILKKTGTGATWMGQGSYDNVYLLSEAIKIAGGTKDIEKLIKTLETIETNATTGKVKFEPKSHQAYMGYPYYTGPFAQWQGEGNVKLLYPPEVVQKNNPGAQFIHPKELREKAKTK